MWVGGGEPVEERAACVVGGGEWGRGPQAARARDLGDSVFLTDVITKFSIILQAFHAAFLT